jgi:antitoxin PrlF
LRITSKGQVTIPQAIREQLGLLPNTEVEFAVERGAAVLRRKRGSPTRAERIVAHLKTHGGAKMRMSSKALLALLRDEPDEIDAR